MNGKEITTKDIIVALRYCISDTGDFCDMCPYAKFGNTCSKKLLRDASDKIKSLIESEE